MFRGATLPAQPRGDDTGHVAVAGLFVNGSSQPDAEPHPLAPATHMTASMAPVATANPSPAAAPPPLSVMAISVVAMMPTTVRDLFHFEVVIAFEDSRIRLVQFIENSVALGNAGNRASRSGYARKRHGPRNAQHSREKQPTFHQNLPNC
jgi:hypothetical protein